MLELFGEVGASSCEQLTSHTHFTKVNNKEVIPKNQCVKCKKKIYCDSFPCPHNYKNSIHLAGDISQSRFVASCVIDLLAEWKTLWILC